ncbi:arginine transporter [Pseudoroseicyclus sp. CXY001]|uniref:arginine transporter n=1 Tax=Pseudoroseicyclus sp. CXY001 TaxID=3242492 RepID=UPI0035714A79
MAGGRSAANPALCSCVQRVADQSLSNSDQRRAATFFEDPHLAQEARTADTPAMEDFWRRYRAFATAAERACG